LSPGRVCATAQLTSNGHAVAATSNEITFDDSIFSIESCFINPSLTPLGKSLSRVPLVPSGERVSVAGGPTPIPDGMLYACTLTIEAGAANGAYVIDNVAAATNAAAMPLPATGTDGMANISNCAADCDGNGTVSIGEVSRARGLFLGEPLCNSTNQNLSCPPADMITVNNSISIGEVTRASCLFLNGTCSRMCP
jgi:hypothetical protein